MTTEIDLNFLARQLDVLIAEQRLARDAMRDMRDTLAVQSAMLVRQSGRLDRLSDEVALVLERVREIDRRLTKLEPTESAP